MLFREFNAYLVGHGQTKYTISGVLSRLITLGQFCVKMPQLRVVFQLEFRAARQYNERTESAMSISPYINRNVQELEAYRPASP